MYGGLILQACADKLKREIAEFGYPPIFPAEEGEGEGEGDPEGGAVDPADPTRRVKKVCLEEPF